MLLTGHSRTSLSWVSSEVLSLFLSLKVVFLKNVFGKQGMRWTPGTWLLVCLYRGIRVLRFFLMKWCFQFFSCCFRNEKWVVRVTISEYFVAGKNSLLFVRTGLFLVSVYWARSSCKSWKVPISIVMSVHLACCPHTLTWLPLDEFFLKCHIGVIYVNLLTELKFGYSGPKASGISCDLSTFYCWWHKISIKLLAFFKCNGIRLLR